MPGYRSKLVELMEVNFGVSPEFMDQLAPVLDRIADSRPAAREWEEMLTAMAAAYHASPREEVPEVGTLDETRVLIGQFVKELKKMDESLKVLAVYLERLNDRAEPTPRTLH